MVKFIDRFKLDVVVGLLQDFPVVALTGARQVGKTTLARRIADDMDGTEM